MGEGPGKSGGVLAKFHDEMVELDIYPIGRIVSKLVIG